MDPQRTHSESQAVLERLSAVLKPESAHAWLYGPNPELDNQKPADLLARGEVHKVLGLIESLAEGDFV